VKFGEHRYRIRQVFEHMARYDEVLAFVGEAGEPVQVEVRHDVGLREAGGFSELRK